MPTGTTEAMPTGTTEAMPTGTTEAIPPRVRWARRLTSAALSVAATLSGCHEAPGALKPFSAATLTVFPALDRGYAPQTVFEPYVRASIRHVLLRLYTLEGDPLSPTEVPVTDTQDQPVLLDVPAENLARPVSFANLRWNTRYRVRAFAYDGPGTSEGELISTADAGSYVDVAVGTDDAPIVTTLRVKLRDRITYAAPLGANSGLPDAASQLSGAEWAPQATYNSVSDEFLLVWLDDRHGVPAVYARRLSRTGTLLGAELRVTSGASAAGVPAVAHNTTANEYVVCWSEDRGSTGHDILGQRVSAAGALLGSPLVISEAPARDQHLPAIAYHPGNNGYFVAWSEHRGATGYDVVGRRLAGTGAPSGSDAVVSEATGEQLQPRVARNVTAGEFMLVWQEERAGNGFDVVGARVDAAGARIGADFLVSGGTDAQEQPALAFNPSSSEHLVTWQQQRAGTGWDIMARRLTSAGALTGTEVTVSATNNPQLQPATTHRSVNNEYTIAWYERRPTTGWDVMARRLSAAGGLLTGDVVISASPNAQWLPTVAFAPIGPQLLVAWGELGTTGSDVRYSIVGSTGVGTARTLGDPKRAYRQDLSVRLASHGSFAGQLLAWIERDETATAVKAQLVNHQGVAQNAPVTLSSSTGAKDHLAVAFHPAGSGYMVAWQEYRGDAGWDVVARRVGANGEALGGEIEVAAGGNPQERPAIAVDASAYMLVWQECRGNLGGDILARRIGTDGLPVGDALVVAAADHAQEQPAIAFDAAAQSYVFAWSEQRSLSGWDVATRRLALSGALGAESPVAASTDSEEAPALSHDAATGRTLIAWQALRGASYNILAGRLAASGGLEGAAVEVAGGAEPQEVPAIAFNPTAREHLLVWQVQRADSGWDVAARRLAVDGSPIGAALAISSASRDQIAPALSHNLATNTFLICWRDGRASPDGGNFDRYTQLVDSFASD